MGYKKNIRFNGVSELLHIDDVDTAEDILKICKTIARLEIQEKVDTLGLYYGMKEIPKNCMMKEYAGKRLDFEVKPKYLRTENFSNPGVDARLVLKDFNIHYVESRTECKWFLDTKEVQQAPEFCESIVSLYLNKTTNCMEKSRSIVKAILLAAVNSVEDSGIMVFEDEVKLEYVINGVHYSGDVDIALGHSLDSCMLVVEGSSFQKGLGQVIAQAATSLKMRENGLPIFLIRTDGLKWQFGMLSKPNDKLLLKTCFPISLDVDTTGESFKQSLGKVYSWVAKIVKEINM